MKLEKIKVVKEIKFGTEQYINVFSGISGAILAIVVAIIGSPTWFTEKVGEYSFVLWLFVAIILGFLSYLIIYGIIWWACCRRAVEKKVI